MADSYTTLNTMLMANHIPPETAEQIICDTLRFLQFQSICDTLPLAQPEPADVASGRVCP